MKNQTNLDDIVFENRNKDYGAYYLRKNYSNYLTRAMLIGSSCFMLTFGGAFTYSHYLRPKPTNTANNNGTWVILKPPVEPPIEKPDLETPKEPEKRIEQRATIKFQVITPVYDHSDIIESPPPTPDDMEGRIISSTTTDGTVTDDLIPPPVTPDITKTIALEPPVDDKIFLSVEQLPEFPDGIAQLYKFLSKNIHYPEEAVKANVGGKVFVKFVVEKDGSIGDIQISKGIGFGCDEEAVRVIRLMPKWNPGKQNGKAVRVYYHMPIVYKLQ
jgi:periplasmic protein TonB